MEIDAMPKPDAFPTPAPTPHAEDDLINRLGLSADELRLVRETHVENAQRVRERLSERAVELTDAQQELAGAVASELDRTLREYGIAMPDRPAPHVIALERDDFLASTGKVETPHSRTGGVFIPAMSTIVLRYMKKAWGADARNETFVSILAHESVHAASIQRMQTILTEEGDAAIESHRSGLEICELDNPKRSTFSDLNEAVTELLAITVSNRIIRSRPSQFRKAATRQIIHYLQHAPVNAPWRKLAVKMGWRTTNSDDDAEEVAWRLFRDKRFPYSVGRERFRSYVKQRRILKQIMDEIRKRNTGDYSTSKDVEALFYRAMVGGSMLELGRVVEKTFGAGTFRLMAEDCFGKELRERLGSIVQHPMSDNGHSSG